MMQRGKVFMILMYVLSFCLVPGVFTLNIVYTHFEYGVRRWLCKTNQMHNTTQYKECLLQGECHNYCTCTLMTLMATLMISSLLVMVRCKEKCFNSFLIMSGRWLPVCKVKILRYYLLYPLYFCGNINFHLQTHHNVTVYLHYSLCVNLFSSCIQQKRLTLDVKQQPINPRIVKMFLRNISLIYFLKQVYYNFFWSFPLIFQFMLFK